MALLDDVKLALRITSSAFDSEISDLIAAARADLIRAGVEPTRVNVDDVPLVRRAIIVYCKGNFGYDNPEAERFLASYDLMRQELSLSSGYKVVSTDETP
jgi:uncharacterized phage protein (predicted DNA packaging)